MTERRFSLSIALVGVALVSAACAPQVVDAVDTKPETGGSSATGGTAGEGGNDPSGGSSGSGGASGSSTCPDGGSLVDRDGDGVADCFDGCPGDPLKTLPVTCGCGLPEPVPGGGISCLDLQPLLAHRYRFDGTGTLVVDSVPSGDANGVIVNTELAGNGTVVLQGAQLDQYVDLPNRIVSGLPSLTLEAWLEWNGGGPWQRIFDFGEPLEGLEDVQSGGKSYLFLTPKTPDVDVNNPTYRGPYLRATYGRPQGTGIIELRANAELNSPRIFPSGRLAHAAVAVDGVAGSMFVYIDGVLVGSYDSQPPIEMSLVNDINCWLGKSQFEADEELSATYYEFRIYNAALTAEEIDLSYRAGPDPPFFP